VVIKQCLACGRISEGVCNGDRQPYAPSTLALESGSGILVVFLKILDILPAAGGGGGYISAGEHDVCPNIKCSTALNPLHTYPIPANRQRVNGKNTSFY